MCPYGLCMHDNLTRHRKNLRESNWLCTETENYEVLSQITCMSTMSKIPNLQGKATDYQTTSDIFHKLRKLLNHTMDPETPKRDSK